MYIDVYRMMLLQQGHIARLGYEEGGRGLDGILKKVQAGRPFL